MSALRAFNVITLACLLLLTGCFGLADESVSPPAEGQELNSTVVILNHAPQIDAFYNHMYEIDEYRILDNSTGTNTISVTGANVSMYHSAIDIDGDNLTMGWDTNLDGSIDVNTSSSNGFTMLYLPLSAWHAIPGVTNELTASIAFIAIDSNGAGNSQIIHINTPQFMQVTSDYAFDGEDANGSPTDGTDDNLIRMTMTQGSDINWAAISVKVSVNNGAPVTCDNSADGTAGCVLVEFGATGDQVWSVGDGVTIKENGVDLCSTACVIEVTITDTSEGKTLDNSDATAE